MADKPNKPDPIRPKTILKVGPRGKVETGAVVRHPSPVERIALVHRRSQSAFANIRAQLPSKGGRRGG